jgi:RNA-directed DNA polymerase
MPNQNSSAYRLLMQRTFCQVRSVNDLARLLETEVFALDFFAQNPAYHTFEIPKKTGGFRLIEDPDDVFKEILRLLNHYLQSCYFINRSSAAYGFQLADEVEADSRNIKTNAQRHLRHDWLLNADFLNFFHYVSHEAVLAIFSKEPFNFKEDLALLLANLTTYKGRLPMGSPTSPVLSNFATLTLDHDLLSYAQTQHFTYTRFADDLTFSSFSPINTLHITDISVMCSAYGFVFNEKKVHIFSPKMPKMVTGLKVSDTIGLPDDYLPNLTKEIKKFATVMEINFRTGKQETKWIKKFEQQIEGHLEFAKFVLGENSMDFQAVENEYKQAQNPQDHYDPIDWLEIGYWKL